MKQLHSMKVPPRTKPLTTVYGDFKGVDFSKDPLLVDKSRSPYAVNVISDKGGQPEKRVGWRVLHTIEQPVNALAYGFINGAETFIAHGGTKLYKWTKEGVTVIKDGINNAKSSIFFMQHQNKSKLFILTGREYLMYDGTTVKSAEEEATIPTILIARKPIGGGIILQPINMIQPKRTERFYGDGTATVYQLSANNIDTAAVSVVKITASGQTTLTENKDFTVDRTAGKVKFNTAPPSPVVSGEDNVYITYSKTVSGYADRVKKCRTSAYYGLGGSNRIFITRNPDYKSQDWWCEINDPAYFPDLNYAVIGNDNTAIMGYSKIGEYLVISKEDNQQDTTHFTRAAMMIDGVATFPIKPSITGVGVVAPYSLVNFIDEPLFLSRKGIFAITSNIVTNRDTPQNRSSFIDNRLTEEPNLQNAVAVEWNGYYVLSVNGNVYLLDSRQKSIDRDSSFVYECYFWNNVHANCFLVHDGELYFGTPTGQICKFNSDIDNMARFNDNGQAITAIWSTKMDNDGIPERLKTMNKKGCLVTLKPLTRSGIKLSVKTEKDTLPKLIREASAGIFNSWDSEIDFDGFSFISNDNARTIVIKKKEKKYQALQFFAMNNKINQGFGLFNIVKSYVPINYVKR